MRTLPALLLGLLVLGGCGDAEPEDAARTRAGAAPPVVDGSVIRVHVHARGHVIVLRKGSDTAAEGMVSLAPGTREGQNDALTWIRDQLRTRTADPTTRAADGTSTLRLHLDLDPDARWQYAQWILQVATDPTIGLTQVRFLEREDPASIDLFLPEPPSIQDLLFDEETGEIIEDEPPQADADTPRRVRVKLFRRNAEDPRRAFTRVRIATEQTFDLPAGPRSSPERKEAYEAVFGQIEDALRGVRDAKDGTIQWVMVMPRPLGLDVPCGDALRLLHAFDAIGSGDVELAGSPPRMVSGGSSPLMPR